MSNEIIVNASAGETRVALLERGSFTELHIERASAAVHLLVGQRENVEPASFNPALENEQPINWLDPDSLWVSIGPQTGQVGTAENDATTAIAAAISGLPLADQVRAARRFAREMHSMGGK